MSRPVDRLRGGLVLLLLGGLLLAVSGDSAGPPLLPVEVGGVALRVELAADDATRRRGLMFRRQLAEDQGMLFVWPDQAPRQIWMLNTPLPLDVGFFDGRGRLLNVVSMQPDGGRRIHHSAAPARYALEVNIDWFARHRVPPGARLRLPAALQAELAHQ